MPHDPWRKGDLALCVRRGHLWTSDGPRAGGVYTVEAVNPAGNALRFEAIYCPPGVGYNAALFRKIKPLSPEEHEEWIRTLSSFTPIGTTPITA